MAKVEFNLENLEKCVCLDCPVQEKSVCVAEKKKIIKNKMEEFIEKGEMPNPNDIPGVYCATEITECGDLDYEKICMCASCPVWQENNLANGMPMGYYCRDGSAK